MRLFCRVFSEPKAGSNADEYEDAAFPLAWEGEANASLRVAIGDGATGASFSGTWARLLVEGYHRSDIGHDDPRRYLAPLQAAWRAATTAEPLPWYAEEKARGGAFAALLGLTLYPPDADGDSGRWEAVSVGDCCLFLVRWESGGGETVTASFPMSREDDFNSRPALLSTNPAANERIIPEEIQTTTGTYQRGDTLYLATDALAAWFLGVASQGRAPWRWFADLGTPAEAMPFPGLVQHLRENNNLKNDDVTLLRVTVR